MEIIKTQEEDNRVSYKIIDPSPEFIEFLQNLQERKEEYRRQVLEECRKQKTFDYNYGTGVFHSRLSSW